jgi:hypothetical protein
MIYESFKMSDFLAILKNSKIINIKFDLQLDFHLKKIL